MTRAAHSGRRYVVLLLFLCVVIFAQSSAVAAGLEHHHTAHHDCLLCHLGTLPWISTAAPNPVAPSLRIVWLAFSADFEASHQAFVPSTSSRAPPA